MKLLVILGPTATGKTDLAIKLAKKFDGEIVSCDSRQVYKNLDIGTGKLSKFPISNFQFSIKKANGYWIVDGIKIWMFDVVSTKEQYTVADYVRDAGKVIDDIGERGKLPIIVGGTGLYLKALLEGLPNLAVPVDQKLRKQIEKLSKEQLQKKLQQINISKWESLNQSDRENPRRLIRAIEIETSSLRGVQRTTKQSYIGRGLLRFARNDVLQVGLIAQREVLYERVDDSVIKRINQGMIEEAEKLQKNGLSLKRMRQLGLEYGVLADYLDGKIASREELIKRLQFKIHGFIRRQLTWFKKPFGWFEWFDITGKNFPLDVEKLIAKWYDSGDVAKS